MKYPPLRFAQQIYSLNNSSIEYEKLKILYFGNKMSSSLSKYSNEQLFFILNCDSYQEISQELPLANLSGDITPSATLKK